MPFLVTPTLRCFNSFTKEEQRAYMETHALYLVGKEAGRNVDKKEFKKYNYAAIQRAERTARDAMQDASYADILLKGTGAASVAEAEKMLKEIYANPRAPHVDDHPPPGEGE